VTSSYVDFFGSPVRIENIPPDISWPEEMLNHLKANIGQYIAEPKLRFQDNNKFRMFIFLHTIDDLFAKFTTKWVANLLTMRKRDAYGLVKWDLGPMIGDFEALTATYFDLRFGIMNELNTLDRLRFNSVVQIPPTPMYSNLGYYGALYFCGSLVPKNVPETITLPILLDEFGLNFRFTDILDAVPFSFLLSHVLPNICAFLDGNHPSKWFDANFTYEGWVTARAYGTLDWKPSSAAPAIPTNIYGFDRYLTSTKPTKKPTLQWQFPGIKALLDAIALLASGASIKKRIGSNYQLKKELTFYGSR
jgi:hypothetical protein